MRNIIDACYWKGAREEEQRQNISYNVIRLLESHDLHKYTLHSLNMAVTKKEKTRVDIFT